MAFKELSKDCPICEAPNKPYEAQVLESGHILNKYTCSRCKWPYVRRDKARPTVEPLTGFTRSPSRWEK